MVDIDTLESTGKELVAVETGDVPLGGSELLLLEWDDGDSISKMNDITTSCFIVHPSGECFIALFPPESAGKDKKPTSTAVVVVEVAENLDQDPSQQHASCSASSSFASSATEDVNVDQENITIADEEELEVAVHRFRERGEAEAEVKANLIFKKWCTEKKSLEQAINEMLEGHLELHEKMTAVRLKFEHEKAKWAQEVMAEAHDVVIKRRTDGENFDAKGQDRCLWQHHHQDQQQAGLYQCTDDSPDIGNTTTLPTTTQYAYKRRKFSTPQKTQYDENN